MVTFSSDKLKKILNLHVEWLKDNGNGVRAYLSGANLSGAKINFPMVCPEEGSFIGFKKSAR